MRCSLYEHLGRPTDDHHHTVCLGLGTVHRTTHGYAVLPKTASSVDHPSRRENDHSHSAPLGACHGPCVRPQDLSDQAEAMLVRACYSISGIPAFTCRCAHHAHLCPCLWTPGSSLHTRPYEVPHAMWCCGLASPMLAHRLLAVKLSSWPATRARSLLADLAGAPPALPDWPCNENNAPPAKDAQGTEW